MKAVKSTVPIGLVVIELVYSQDQRLVVIFSIASEDFCSDLDALRGIYEHYSAVANLESGNHTAYEIVYTRSVDYIQLIIHELCVKRSCINGPLVDLFDFGVV